jgi:hypothetical protein
MSTANPRYSNGSKRRALRARLLRQYGGTACEECGEILDPTIATPHPESCEVDELTPVRHGGSPLDGENTRLIHRRCNRARADRELAAERAERQATPPTFVTRRDWGAALRGRPFNT